MSENGGVAAIEGAIPPAGGRLHEEIPEAFQCKAAHYPHSVYLSTGQRRFAELQHGVAAVAHNQLRRTIGSEFIAGEIVEMARHNEIETGRHLSVDCSLLGGVQVCA